MPDFRHLSFDRDRCAATMGGRPCAARRRSVATLGAIVVFGWTFTFTRAGVPDDCPSYSYTQPGIVQPAAVIEASGIAASRTTPGYFYTHNDNFDDQRIFAISASGELRGTWTLDIPSSVRDPEDIAIGPGPMSGVSYIYLADIGDNANVRDDITVYRAVEPTVSATGAPVVAGLPAQSIRLSYPDGPRDAETLMIDINGDMYVIAKRLTPGKVYRAPFPQSTTNVNVLQPVGQLQWDLIQPTGGDIAADGSAIIVRGYFRMDLWARPTGANIGSVLSQPGCTVPWVVEPQGEAVCFRDDLLDYATVSEGSNPAINFFNRDLPAPTIEGFVQAVLFDATDAASLAVYDFSGDGALDGRDVGGLAAVLVEE